MLTVTFPVVSKMTKVEKANFQRLTYVFIRATVFSGGEGMTAKEFKRKIMAAGWKITQGSRHEIAKHPDKPGVRIEIHRHTGDIPTGTLHKMLKDAGLK